MTDTRPLRPAFEHPPGLEPGDYLAIDALNEHDLARWVAIASVSELVRETTHGQFREDVTKVKGWIIDALRRYGDARAEAAVKEARERLPVPDRQAVWHEAHKVAAEELPRIHSGICQQPGLAAAFANFAIAIAEREREACAKIAHHFKFEGMTSEGRRTRAGIADTIRERGT
jgi:hypothetical protein